MVVHHVQVIDLLLLVIEVVLIQPREGVIAERRGIVLVCQLRHHCVTADAFRDGGVEKVFIKQVGLTHAHVERRVVRTQTVIRQLRLRVLVLVGWLRVWLVVLIVMRLVIIVIYWMDNWLLQ